MQVCALNISNRPSVGMSLLSHKTLSSKRVHVPVSNKNECCDRDLLLWQPLAGHCLLLFTVNADFKINNGLERIHRREFGGLKLSRFCREGAFPELCGKQNKYIPSLNIKVFMDGKAHFKFLCCALINKFC